MNKLRTTLALCFAALVATASFAMTGGLTIQVVDDNGPLPGAIVTIKNAEKRIKDHSEPTNKDGIVRLPVLPAGGAYIVEVSFPGYGTQRRSDLKVKTGENPVITVQLSAEYTEQVKVVAEREVVDLEKTSQSTRFTDDFISDLPVPGRFYQNVLTLAPGVQDADGDGNPNVHGGRDRDFKTMVSGVSNVDPLTGQFATLVNPNSIEEMEVITAGAGPEFGRAQSGFANIIQKQGGNDFEGVFDFILRSSVLDGDGAASLSPQRTPKFETLQPSVQVSGPVIKDRLWYRLSHEWIDREDPVNTTNAVEVVTNEIQVNSDQLTWQVSDRNKLAFKYDANPQTVSNFGVSSLTPVESSRLLDWTRDTYSVVWSAPYSPQIFVESVVALFDQDYESFPTVRGIGSNCVSGQPFLESGRCFNAETGEVSGSWPVDFSSETQRFTMKTDATIYPKNKFLGMTHEYKFGMIVENERYRQEFFRRPSFSFFTLTEIDDAQSGGTTDISRTGVVIATFSVPQDDRSSATGATWGVYFKDQMKPAQNVTIEFGGRVDREIVSASGVSGLDPQAEFELYNQLLAQTDPSLELVTRQQQARVGAFTAFEGIVAFKNQLASIMGVSQGQTASFFGPVVGQSAFQTKFRQPSDIHITNTNVAPFLAVTWDPWSNNRTKFAASAGRYYDKIFLSVPASELVPSLARVRLNAARVGGGWAVTSLQSQINPAASLQVVDRDLRTPHQDELTAEFQRQLWAETSLSVRYVRRKFRDQLQDIDINHVAGDFGICNLQTSPTEPVLIPYEQLDQPGNPYPRDGIDDCTGEYFLPPGTDPSSNPDPFAPDNRLQRPDGFPDLYRLNPFWGPIYQIGNHNQAEYQGVVLELIRRQYRGWELQGSYTWSMARGDGEDFEQVLGDDQSLLDDEKGFQSYDQRHVVKTSATTITPWGVRLGGTVTWQSGLPYSLLRRRIAIDTNPPSIGEFGSNEPRTRLQYLTGSRNDQRNRSYWRFDLKASKDFSLGRGMNLQLSGEVYNLLNEGTYFVYNRFTRQGVQINGNNEAFRDFGRSFQMSMKLSF